MELKLCETNYRNAWHIVGGHLMFVYLVLLALYLHFEKLWSYNFNLEILFIKYENRTPRDSF